jgi:hypothetical protein
MFGTNDSTTRGFLFDTAINQVQVANASFAVQDISCSNITVKTSIICEGSFTANTVTSMDNVSLSDLRLKKDIEPISDALNVVCGLQGKTYKMADHKVRYGLIAQEVEEILPHLVQEEPSTGMKSVNYIGLVAWLVEAIKELKALQKCT